MNLHFYEEKYFVKTFLENWVNRYIFHMIVWCSVLMALNVLSIFKLNVDFTETLFHKSKINRYGVYFFKN